MSLQQFLAVGRSFAESPREKSPFGIRKDVRLPTFENAPRFAARAPVPVQTDWLQEKAAATAPAEPFVAAPRNPVVAQRRKRSWLERLTFGLLGKPKLTAALVQAEMNLEKVRVIRNDLADSDLEVVVKKGQRFALRRAKMTPKEAAVVETPAQPAPRKRREWSELTARLFEIGQQ